MFVTRTAPPVQTARPEAERIDALVSHLKRNYAVAPAAIRVAKVPLRICPLGAHIDHQLGMVTGMTIDQYILLAFEPTDDGSVQVESLNVAKPISFHLGDVPPYRRGDWGNYIRGAVLALQQDHELERGLVGVVGGDMPIGGLSSSAAVTIAYLLALEAINGLELSPEDNVSLVSYTENEYIGLNNGILDQSTILFSQPQHLTLIDPQTMAIDRIPTPLKQEDFVILAVYSGVTHVLVGTDYNNRVAECQEAARLLLSYAGQEAAEPEVPLRRVPPEIFKAEGHRLPPNLQRRATHYFGEMQRVADGITAWRLGDLPRLGRLMTASGESSVKYYECGSPQLITLYETLRDAPGVHGTRFSGAGFRGNCLALVEPEAAETIAEMIHRHYPEAHPAEAEAYSIHYCCPSGPAHLVAEGI